MSTVKYLESKIAIIDDHIARLREAKEELPEKNLKYNSICSDIFGTAKARVGLNLLNTIDFAYRVVPEGWNIVVERDGYCRITDWIWIYSDLVENNPAAALATCLCDWKIAELRDRREKLHAQLCRAREDEIGARIEAELARPKLGRFVMLSAPVIAIWLLFFDALR